MSFDKPYGTWESPITSKAITGKSKKLFLLYYDDYCV